MTVISQPGARRRPLAFAGLLAAAALLLGVVAPAAATPDFNGVWQTVNPPLALLTADGREPPLLPAAKKLYEQRKVQLAKGDLSFDGTETRCAPPGEPRIYSEGMPFDIVQTPKQLLFGYQWNRLVRFVNFDVPMDVLSPYYFGTSVGHFDGNTLVVDTQGFNDKFFLDRSGMPHSDELHLMEYYTLSADGDTMRLRIHIEDPQTFAWPWDTVLSFKKLPHTRITEDICTMREKLVPNNLLFFDPPAK